MADPRSSIDSRRDQTFPVLEPAAIARLSRFGNPRRYEAGSFVVRAGEKTEGLLILLSGEVRVTPHGSRDQPFVTYGPGSFLGELAHLSGRPALADCIALSDVDGIMIESPRLRDLMVQEADLGERIMRALILRRVGLLERNIGGPIIIGHAGNRDVLRLAGFLRRNGHPYQCFDPDEDSCAKTLIEQFHLSPSDLPAVLCANGQILHNPTERQLARCIGLLEAIDPNLVHDLAIIGAGPAGLAAAVYAASEGLSVLVLDCRAFGGQAGASARIENYLGFPTGISGMALMARAYSQAQKFGAEIAIPEEARRLDRLESDGQGGFLLRLVENETARARAVVIACGAEYRRLDVPDLEQYEGSHVHYWASPLEARLCSGEDVVLVGGGNSAGQAAVYLSGVAGKVWMLVRGTSLDATMSRYLCERIAAQPNIEVLLGTEVTGLEGHGGVLEAIRWRRRETREEMRQQIRHLFLLIGADPNTDWLAQSGVLLDSKGFVVTGEGAGDIRLPFETSLRGAFAIGDVRSGSIKRVAASVGEGASVVSAVHAWLAETRPSAGPVAQLKKESAHG